MTGVLTKDKSLLCFYFGLCFAFYFFHSGTDNILVRIECLCPSQPERHFLSGVQVHAQLIADTAVEDCRNIKMVEKITFTGVNPAVIAICRKIQKPQIGRKYGSLAPNSFNKC